MKKGVVRPSATRPRPVRDPSMTLPRPVRDDIATPLHMFSSENALNTGSQLDNVNLILDDFDCIKGIG